MTQNSESKRLLELMAQTPDTEFASSLIPGGPGRPVKVVHPNDLYKFIVSQLGEDAGNEFKELVMNATRPKNATIIELLKKQVDFTSALLLASIGE